MNRLLVCKVEMDNVEIIVLLEVMIGTHDEQQFINMI